ncbi:MAG TPA: hypothetical protein DD618_03970 [Acholeplasmatales bacterium]|nr:hypothetical protein [Acholeplasmatales bacterium]
MQVIKDLFTKIDGILSTYLDPIVNKIITFLQNTGDTVLALIILFAAILILIGLIRWLKHFKLFLFVVILFGIVIAVWYFFGRA